MSVRAADLPVERGPETGLARYFRVNGSVTVRVGAHKVYCCLTCRVATCVHAEAARMFDRGDRGEPSAHGAGSVAA